MKKVIVTVNLILLISISAFPQWSNDPSVNTLIKNTVDWEIVPHIAVDTSGNYYLSWYSGTPALNFNVYMQFLDSEGYKKWGDDGLLISNNQTTSWVADYHLLTDHDGNAVLSTQDFRQDPQFDVFTYKTNSNGDFLWGQNGIALTDFPQADDFSTSLVVTPANEYIYAIVNYPVDTAQYSSILMQKLNSDGIPQWDNIEIKNDSLHYYWGELTTTSDDNFMATWLYRPKEDTSGGGFGSQTYFHIASQKFDFNGNALWTEPVRIDIGYFLVYDEIFVIPKIVSDGDGGAFVCWHSGGEIGLVSTLVQRVKSDGSLAFEEPVSVSERLGNSHWEPDISFDEETEELFVFYVEYHHEGGDDCWGVSGQKLSINGERLWGDTAIIFYPMECNNYISIWDVNISEGPDNDIGVFFIRDTFEILSTDTIYHSFIYAMRIGSDGEFIWDENNITISSYPGEKDKLDVSDLHNDQWVVTWGELRGTNDPDDFGIYAQNVYVDGSLGVSGINDQYLSSNVSLTNYPNPFNGTTSITVALEEPGHCILSLFNIRGQFIENIFDGHFENANQTIEYNASGLPEGIYLLQLKTEGELLFKKIISHH